MFDCNRLLLYFIDRSFIVIVIDRELDLFVDLGFDLGLNLWFDFLLLFLDENTFLDRLLRC